MTITVSYSNPSSKALRIGSRFHEACLRHARGRVQSTFQRVVNIATDEELLALALPEAGGSSRFLTLDALRPFEPGEACCFTPGRFWVGAFGVDIAEVPVWKGPLEGAGKCLLIAARSEEFQQLLAERQVRPGADGGCGIEPDTVRRWIGLGPGLTPSGDDILVGFMAVYNEFGDDIEWADELREAVLSQLGRTTDLSAQLLRSAAARDYHEIIQRMILALAGLSPNPLERCLEDLLCVGAQSGQDIAFGMGRALVRIESQQPHPSVIEVIG